MEQSPSLDCLNRPYRSSLSWLVVESGRLSADCVHTPPPRSSEPPSLTCCVELLVRVRVGASPLVSSLPLSALSCSAVYGLARLLDQGLQAGRSVACAHTSLRLVRLRIRVRGNTG